MNGQRPAGSRNGKPRGTPWVVAVAGVLTLSAALAPATVAAYVHPLALGLESRADDRRLDATAEIHCLALNVYHEARSEPDAGKLAVIQVTLNRVRSPRYPDSVCKVVWQRGQFSWTRDGRSDRPRNRRAWQHALRLATAAYRSAPSDTVGEATHYHAVYVQPYWSKAFRRVARIGRHVFYAPVNRS